MAAADSLAWTIFCRVIDNLGDAGVCWRLAADLAARGQRVRLVIDDPATLSLVAPGNVDAVEVQAWPGTPLADEDVVIEAFGCDPPESFLTAMAAHASPPLWIDLEYLSAEPWVPRSHGLPSPQLNGLTRWFFFPGFTHGTGGLLREPGLIAARQAFNASDWLHRQGIPADDDHRRVSLFCYANPALGDLLDALATEPTTLLLAQGPAQAQFDPLQRLGRVPPAIRPVHLPWLTQADFDRLLWSCDLNLVRGEDSLVRAIWAGAPFVWQAYPLPDSAHHAKVDAMLDVLQAPPEVARIWQAWNGSAATHAAAAWAPLQNALHHGWPAAAQGARRRLLDLPDLTTRLQAFVRERRAKAVTTAG